MNMTHFIEPLDVLFLRGNKLFGDPGSYGESMIPPWPSVAAGAIRSAILVRDSIDPAAFARGGQPHKTLGTPEVPGDFRITDFRLAWQGECGEGPLQGLYPLPADLVLSRSLDDQLSLQALQPWQPRHGIGCSIPTDKLPVMAQQERGKPVTGYWLTAAGMQAWLRGELPKAGIHLIESSRLWARDERVGVGLDKKKRRAEDGKLFSVQALAFCEGVGFIADTEGDALDDGALLRFGGDGRAARARLVEDRAPGVDLDDLCRRRCARILLTSPGIFPDGWRLPGMAEDGTFELMGVRGRVVSAAVNRAEVISGWDLAQWVPKPALRAAPAGSVYWIEDLKATPEALRKLADRGLWPESGYDAQRRVEGFNRFIFAAWSQS